MQPIDLSIETTPIQDVGEVQSEAVVMQQEQMHAQQPFTQEAVKIFENDLKEYLAMPNSDKYLFIGVGQCGCKIALEMQKRGYTSYYINTARKDLDAIDAPTSYKYYVPNANGCNKDRELGKKYAEDNYERIVKIILDNFKGFTHFVVVYSMGGGTGSSMSVMIMQALVTLTRVLPPEDRPVICPMPVSPRTQDKDQLIRRNTLDCYNDLARIEGLGSMWYISNSQFSEKDEDEVNVQIADILVKILSSAVSNNKNNIDDYEILSYFATPGCVCYADIEEGSIPSKGIEGMICKPNKIFPAPVKDGQDLKLLYSLKSANNIAQCEQAAEAVFGTPQNYLRGYNNESNFVVAFGLPFPMVEIMEITTKYKEAEVKRLRGASTKMQHLDVDLSVPTPQQVQPTQQQVEQVQQVQPTQAVQQPKKPVIDKGAMFKNLIKSK